MYNFFSKVKSIFSNASEAISLKLTGEKFSPETLGLIEDILITSDIGVEVTQQLLEKLESTKISTKHIESKNKNSEILKEAAFIISNELFEITKNYKHNLLTNFTLSKSTRYPSIVMFIGVNGVGKTTTVAKLAKFLKTNSKNPRIVAADTFRAAATEQLSYWAKSIDVDISISATSSDPASLVFDAYKDSINHKNDVILIDTAGRLHNRDDLLAEIEKIKRVISKTAPDSQLHTLLVIDAFTGQSACTQAEIFANRIAVDSIAVTKLDSTAKGGVIIPIMKKHNLKVSMIATGEDIDDLHEFDPRKFADSLCYLQ